MELPDRDERDDDAGLLLSLLLSMLRLELLGFIDDEIPEEFWQRVRDETESNLTLILLGVFLASARFHGATSETILAEAVRFAQANAGNAAGSFTETSRERIEKILAEWESRRANGETIPETEIAERTQSVFGDARAELLGVTAVTVAQTGGGEYAMNQNSGDTWVAVGDERTCPTCGGLDGTTRAEWGKSYPSGPPAHPVCRCFISYAV